MTGSFTTQLGCRADVIDTGDGSQPWENSDFEPGGRLLRLRVENGRQAEVYLSPTDVEKLRKALD